MKSNFKFLITALFLSTISFSLVNGQEKKEEKKIKIIIADGSGTKVVIDTLIKDGTMSDSIKLKDGKVLYFSHSGDRVNISNKEEKDHMFVTVSSNNKKSGKEVREITVVSSDTIIHTDKGNGNIYVYTDAKGNKRNKGGQYRVISRSSGGEGSKAGIVYINSGNEEDLNMGKNFDIYITEDDKKSDTEKTKYVIKRDGMVISVEGSDYDKVKELVNEIESKLEKKQEGESKNNAAQTAPKTTAKKK